MNIYKIDIYEILSKGDICFYDWICKKRLFYLLCLLDDFRTRNKCFGCWTLSSSHYVRYPVHTTNICCQKESRLVVIPFAANDVFRIMEITLTPGHFLIFFQFWRLLSIWPYCSYGVNSVLKKFIDQCWVVKKIVKKQGAINLFQTIVSPQFPLN